MATIHLVEQHIFSFEERVKYLQNIKNTRYRDEEKSIYPLFRLLNGRVHTPIISKAALNTDQKWPLIVFSHGLGCARFTYSQICYDLASYGFMVIAPEHRYVLRHGTMASLLHSCLKK